MGIYLSILLLLLWLPVQAHKAPEPLSASSGHGYLLPETPLIEPQAGKLTADALPQTLHPTKGDEPERKKPKSWKKKWIAIALCAGLGWAGAHRYYLGAKKPWLTPGYMVLNIVLWFSDLFTLIADRDGMDRFYFTNRLFAVFNL